MASFFSLFQKCLRTNSIPSIQTSRAIVQLYPIRYLGASTVFQTLISKSVQAFSYSSPQNNSQQRQPRSKRIPNCIHRTDNQGSLFCIASTNLIRPRIDHCRNSICRPTEEESKVLQHHRNIPDSEDYTCEDIEQSHDSNERYFGIVCIGDNSPDDA